MTLTRAQAEQILLRRLGTWLGDAGLDNVTDDGTNADLNDPIASALLELGYTVSSITAVTSTDMASVPDTDALRVLAFAELRTLETIALTLPTRETSGLGFSRKSGLAVGQAIDRLRAQIAGRYGIGGTSLSGGHLSLDFAETE